MIAEEQLSPRGPEREDLRTALLCTVVSRSMGSKKAEIKDFMLKFEKENQTAQQIGNNFMSIGKALKKK